MLTTPQNKLVVVRLALSCVTCDIPASRKVSGFLGHNAILGCSRFLKKFTVVACGPSDFSGYDRENWEKRTVVSHRKHCCEIMKENTKTGMRKMESKYGVRYTVLLSLPSGKRGLLFTHLSY